MSSLQIDSWRAAGVGGFTGGGGFSCDELAPDDIPGAIPEAVGK